MTTSDTLELARKQLSDTDYKLITLYNGFEFNSSAIALPNVEQLTNMILEGNLLPKEVFSLAQDRNTPIALFAGVAQFLSAQSRHEKKADFLKICDELCNRNETSRMVYEDKLEKKTDDTDVVTFIPEQHKKVVDRAGRFAREINPKSTGLYLLSRLSTEYCAAINAGWQDMAINGKPQPNGPFVEPQTAESRIVIQYPDFKPVA